MNSLPTNLSQAKYEKALEFAKLSSKAYDMDDILVIRFGMAFYCGIDDIKRQDFRTPNYRKVGSAGNYVDWLGGKDSGLDYSVFEHKTTKNLVIAFRGTEPLSLEDWYHNTMQILGKAGQYEDAVKLAREWVTKLEGTGVGLSFTGHSLGGGLATVAALATGEEAIVFEAAGISSKTMQNPELGLDINNASKITNFNVRECWLSDWNHQMDETTLGTVEPDEIAKQYGEIFWLERVSDRADFVGPLVSDETFVTKKADTLLAHAPHVFTYQLEHKNFAHSIIADPTGRRGCGAALLRPLLCLCGPCGKQKSEIDRKEESPKIDPGNTGSGPSLTKVVPY